MWFEAADLLACNMMSCGSVVLPYVRANVCYSKMLLCSAVGGMSRSMFSWCPIISYQIAQYRVVINQ